MLILNKGDHKNKIKIQDTKKITKKSCCLIFFLSRYIQMGTCLNIGGWFLKIMHILNNII